MSRREKCVKRGFDIAVAFSALVLLWPVILVTWALARHDTGASGFFRQERVGRHGRPFKVIKIRTMLPVGGSTVTAAGDMRITALGAKLRRFKLDELPQLWNVLIGEMSMVGPRPDVPGYMDQLRGDDRELLTLRPGMTGPATLRFRDEEDILAAQDDPQAYNDNVIWPEKVRLNREYLSNWSLAEDLRLLKKTVSR